jgi:DegV family protein with EDD domain
MAVRVITDSTASIPVEMLRGLDVTVVSLTVVETDRVTPDVEVELEAFYKRLARPGRLPTTSQPSVGAFCAAFEQAIQDGGAAVGVFIAAEMSGTFAAAVSAREAVLAEHPRARIELVDSRSSVMQQGFVVLAAARAARQSGATVESVLDATRAAIARGRFFFVLDTLDFIYRGGRIGGASALVGSLLQIKPILTVADGRVVVLHKVRTLRRAIAGMVDDFERDVNLRGLREALVQYTGGPERARELARAVGQRLGQKLAIAPVGCVVGIHVGPGGIGLAYVTER